MDLLQIVSTNGMSAAVATKELPLCESQANIALFETLVEGHYRRVYSVIYRMVQNEQDAADLTQETFVRVYRALPRLRAEGAQGAWIRRIATNLCLDYLRKRKSTPSTFSIDARQSENSDQMQSWEIADPTNEPELILTVKDRREMLLRAVNSLPDEYRMVVQLHHLEDMRVDEIAVLMGVPTGTIKSRLSRARRELHRKLGHYFDPNHV